MTKEEVVRSSSTADKYLLVSQARAYDRYIIKVQVPENISQLASMGTDRVNEAVANLGNPYCSLTRRTSDGHSTPPLQKPKSSKICEAYMRHRSVGPSHRYSSQSSQAADTRAGTGRILQPVVPELPKTEESLKYQRLADELQPSKSEIEIVRMDPE